MNARRPVFLCRRSELDLGELPAAAEHFDVAESRLDVDAGDLVIARHFAWPWPSELDLDLRSVGATALNGARGYRYAANVLAWAPDLGDLTPRTWEHFEQLPDDGTAFILKGEHADKGRWARMFAASKADAIRLRSELMCDTGMRAQTIVAREYVPLERLAEGVGGACPLSMEFRVFVAFGEVLSAGLYWPPEDYDVGRPVPSADEIPAAFLASAIARVHPCLDFYTLDVARAADGRWLVIEVSDGLRAGLSENDPEVLYAALARVLASRR